MKVKVVFHGLSLLVDVNNEVTEVNEDNNGYEQKREFRISNSFDQQTSLGNSVSNRIIEVLPNPDFEGNGNSTKVIMVER